MATRQINLEVSLKNERTFNDAMKKVTNNLDGLKSEMALCSAEFKGNEKSQEALAQKSKILSQQVDQQKVRVEALTQMYEKQRDKLGEDSAAADKYRKELNYAKAELVKMEKAQEETNKTLEDAKAAVLRMEKAQAEANEELEKANAKNKQYVTILDRTKGKVSNLVSALKEKVSALKAAAKNVPGLSDALQILGGAAKKAGPALLTVSKAALTAGGRLAKWTAAAGAAAAVAAGTMMVAGVKTLAEWGTAAIESAKAAEEAGQPLTNAQRQWLDYSKTLDQLKPRAESAKAAMSSLLLPALRLLSDEGGKLLSSFDEELNAVAGDPAGMGRVISKYIRLGAQFISQKLPEIMELADEFLDALGEGFAENKDEIKASVETIIKSLVGFAADHADDIGEIAVFIISTLAEAVIDNAPELLGAGLEILLKLIEGIASGLPDFLTKDLPQMLKEIWNKIVEIAPDFAEAGKAIMQALWNGLASLVSSIGSWLSGIFSGWGSSASAAANSAASVHSAYSGRTHGGRAGSFASGLNYVPYDNFPALLHKGEMVLTAAQSAQYRAGNGGAPATASAGAAAAGNGGTYIENINVQTVPQTPAETAAAIRAALEQARWL